VTVQTITAQGVILLLAAVLADSWPDVPPGRKADFRTTADTAARIYTADYLGAALVPCWSAPS